MHGLSRETISCEFNTHTYASFQVFYVHFIYCFRFPSLQTSKEIWLSKCHLYPMETLMKQAKVKDCVSVGMKLPNGTYERPINEAHLFWVRPGNQF